MHETDDQTQADGEEGLPEGAEDKTPDVPPPPTTPTRRFYANLKDD